MAKPDMSRNKDLAGKTVSKGGYNISYNENGYATSAIKTGSKTGKAAAPSADTVSGGGSDRGSYGGSVYDQEHFSNDELRSAAEVRAAAAAGKTTWADAHDYVERIRSNYGYSGDSDGSRYIPLEMGGGGRGNGGGGFSYEAAPTYTSRYQNQIDDLTRQILNREAFSYDPEKDPAYQQYKESYTRSGERAMQDTLGQVSARTGGLASSYAGSAAQQTYDNYMGALADKIPELKQLAYSMYQDEGNTQRANLEMLVALEQGTPSQVITVTAAHMAEGSSMYLRPGERLTLEELLYGLLLCSGNDAALALTECAGGVAPFVERMNEKAAALGMRNSHFANPNGLDDEAHYSTAYDMALLGCAAVNEPTLRRMVSTRTAVIGGRTLTNHNKLLSRLDGCVGLKTGYTKAAGRTLVSCAEQAGHRLVAVTLRDGDDWNDHEALYRWGFLLTGIQETLETRLLGALGNGREVTP